MALGTTRAKMVSGERLIVLFQARFLQAVGFTSVCSTWCRGRGQSGAVISWYAAVRNEARARRMMLRGDDFWQFASNLQQVGYSSRNSSISRNLKKFGLWDKDLNFVVRSINTITRNL